MMIIEVELLVFPGVRVLRTPIWISERVRDEMVRQRRSGQAPERLLMLLKRWSSNGFQAYQGAGGPIRYE